MGDRVTFICTCGVESPLAANATNVAPSILFGWVVTVDCPECAQTGLQYRVSRQIAKQTIVLVIRRDLADIDRQVDRFRRLLDQTPDLVDAIMGADR